MEHNMYQDQDFYLNLTMIFDQFQKDILVLSALIYINMRQDPDLILPLNNLILFLGQFQIYIMVTST